MTLYTIRHPVQAWRSRQRVRQQLAHIQAASYLGLPLLWIGCQAASLSNIV